MYLPWVEVYRPKTIDDLSHQTLVKTFLKRIVLDRNMPHLLFYGPPGTGKTSAVHALCRELFKEHWRVRTLELNASDERGIAVVREKVKGWTRTVVANEENLPPWKIVVLDEADMMTVDAQSALRRIIEDSAKNTRFVFICNYISHIIDPLRSRCSQHRFEPVDKASLRERLLFIAQSESMILTDDTTDKLIEVSEGDMRIMITALQVLKTVTAGRLQPTVNDVESVAGVPPDTIIVEFLQAVAQKQSEDVVEKLLRAGWDVNQIIKKTHKRILNSTEFSDSFKAMTSLNAAEVQHRLTVGTSEKLQLLHFAMEMQNNI